MPYKINLHPKAQKDCQYWRKHNLGHLRKIKQLLKAIRENPFEGIGKPEPLRYDLQHLWSRRITDKHRIWYEVEGNLITILRCYGHY